MKIVFIVLTVHKKFYSDLTIMIQIKNIKWYLSIDLLKTFHQKRQFTIALVKFIIEATKTINHRLR